MAANVVTVDRNTPSDDAELAPFHEYLEMDADDRADHTPFIYTVDAERRLQKVGVSRQIVELAEERQRFWSGWD